MRRRAFTGWHMTGILVSFFLVVIAVNLTMARFAISTFGGTVVDNSYVASQNFNRWLATADHQRKAGWAATIKLERSRRVAIQLSHPATAKGPVTLHAVASHVLGRADPVALSFHPTAQGLWQSQIPLPQGRWDVKLEAKQADSTARFQQVLG